ncbi:uncharacterized protein FPRO_11405 [Fusarium proliferatum ET1]|uniref:Uncharacterized protein n=1 Tax=Fusarium proliferatum (strain ET1) TaxID=1227346 RepID=A0A1L7VZX2_FUSPR|nr:uncharacterized protein FPRO_11405 [Fusarium proliferatum ET1]CZR45958.1 uncharacterized protein FPRO_11405 [Fusarium proliferatum ET1]
MAEDLIKFAQTITYIPRIIEHKNAANQLVTTQGAHYPPADSVHFLETASSKSSSGKLAKHNLSPCLVALDDMRKYYVSINAAYKLFDRARIMVDKSLHNDEIVSQGSTSAADCLREPQGIETSEWLDKSASLGFDVASVGLFSALWMPFADLIPDESLDSSF